MNSPSRVCRNCNYVLEGLARDVHSCPECGKHVGTSIFTNIQFAAARTNRTLVWILVFLLGGGSVVLIFGTLLNLAWAGVFILLLILTIPVTLFFTALHSLSLDPLYENAPRRSPLKQVMWSIIFAAVGTFLWILATTLIGLCVTLVWVAIRGLTK